MIDRIKGLPHSLPHSKMEKRYSTGIYCGFDSRKKLWSDLTEKEKKAALHKDWYVRWSYRNPKNGKMERKDNIYGWANQYGTRSERMEVLKSLKKNLESILDDGFSPHYNDNVATSITKTVDEAISCALEIKKLHMKPESFTRYKSDINKFKDYLSTNGYRNRFITSVTKNTVTGFLNEILKDVSPRSRNNYRTNIGTLWQCMEDEGIIKKNFVKSIKLLKSVPKRNRTWTDRQAEEILDYLKKNDSRLFLVVQFVSYNFLRPKEVMRLTVGSFNLQDQTLSIEVKGGKIKTKLVPDIMMESLPNMDGLENNVHIIGKTDVLQYWDIETESKRGRISDAFREVKKKFGLGEEYGIYSFRHYYITKLYRKLREELSPFETKSKLMEITGHETMAALEKYLRSIDAELPKDYSSMLK